MDVSLTVWVLTIVGLCALIAVDFFIGGRKPHEVSIKEAGIWTAVWIVLAALFGLGLLRLRRRPGRPGSSSRASSPRSRSASTTSSSSS